MDGVARIAGRDIWIKKNRKTAGVIADRGSIGQEKGGDGGETDGQEIQSL